jgi:RND family efflux transporter MFP subunit
MSPKVLAIVAALLVFAASCSSGPTASEPKRRAVSETHFTDHTELFVEFPALVRGLESPFAAHVTLLDTFKPLRAGRVSVLLSGGGAPDERFAADKPTVPGIFRPVATPAYAGSRALSVTIEGDGFSDRHDLGTVEVHPDVATASNTRPAGPDHQGPAITLLKEQQWRVPFATAAVTERPVRESLRAHGVMRPRSDGEARVAAPLTGRVVTSAAQAPKIGMTVTPETILAVIAPRLSDDTDPDELARAVERARRDVDLARRERARLESLYGSNAVPERRVIEARHAESDAAADLATAEHRLRQYQGIHRASDEQPVGRITVRSPIAGTLVEARVAPGEFVEEGRVLFDVVDLERLWLEARISEADLARVRDARGAWFWVEGIATPFEVSEGSVVARGGVVDAKSRTAPLIFDVPNPQKTLAVGMFADVNVLTGEERTVLAIPTSAVVDDGGESVAYVEREGESFERRSLTLGVRDGDFVEVIDGLSHGERVVTRGAYYVRLAAASGAIPAHGHAH